MQHRVLELEQLIPVRLQIQYDVGAVLADSISNLKKYGRLSRTLPPDYHPYLASVCTLVGIDLDVIGAQISKLVFGSGSTKVQSREKGGRLGNHDPACLTSFEHIRRERANRGVDISGMKAGCDEVTVV